MPIVELALDASKAKLGANDFDAAANQVARSTDKIKSSTSDSASGFTKIRESVNNAGPMIIAGFAAIGAAFVGIAVKTTKLASDLEETQNKYDVVFKGMTETTDAWAVHLRQNYLMTTEEAKRFMSSTQDLLVPMGVAADKAAAMSFETAKLAADLGSFNNLPTSQVMNDIQSALVGNYETMKKYGVVVNSTLAEEKARQMGLVGLKEDVDTASKAQAAYQLILEASNAAVGDIERSSGSYANQVKQLESNTTELLTILGQIFLPIATEVVTALNTWLSNQENLNKVIHFSVEAVRFLYNGFKGLLLVAKGVIAGIGILADIFVKGFRAMLLPVDLLMKALVKLGVIDGNPLDALQQGVEDFKNSAIEGFQKTWESVEDGNQYFDNLKGKLTETSATLNGVKVTADATAGAMSNLTEKVAGGIPVYDMVKNAAGVYEEVLVGVKVGANNAAKATNDLKNATNNGKEAIDEKTEEVKKNEAQLKRAAIEAANLKARYDSLGSGARSAATSVNTLSNALAVQSASKATGGGGGPWDMSVKNTATSSVNIPQLAGMSVEEWQALSQQDKDRLKWAVDSTTADSDYFNTRPGQGRSRFRGGTDMKTNVGAVADSIRHAQQVQETHQTTVTNVFNQNVSRSDVINIVEEMNRSFARA